jgi:DNA repair protein RAD50
MQVAVTRDGNPKFKTLESVLKIFDEENEIQYSLSSKCAEIDKEMPVHLGVSKPILQNVIFCHQEESLWPVSDPATLKKKFDDIFDATKYTKALENIRSLKKKLNEDFRLKQVYSN